MWIYHNLFIHSLVDEHLDCFQVLAVMNKYSRNIHIQIFVWTCTFISLKLKLFSNMFTLFFSLTSSALHAWQYFFFFFFFFFAILMDLQWYLIVIESFPGGSVVKNTSASAGDAGSISGLGRPPVEGNGNPLQYSCLEKPHRLRRLADCSPWGHKESDTI